MQWSFLARVFCELGIILYFILQSLKFRYLTAKPFPAFWESWARVSLVVTPCILLLLFLREPQTVPVLLVLIMWHVLLAADWMSTYLVFSSGSENVDRIFQTRDIITSSFRVFLTIKIVLILMRIL